MRKHDIVKTIQLIIFILLTAFGCYKIFTNHSLYHMIASDPDVRIMFALLWFVLGLSFFFIFLDFSLPGTGFCGALRSRGRDCQPLQLRRAH